MVRDVDGFAERRDLRVAGADLANADRSAVDPHAHREVGDRPRGGDVARIVTDDLQDAQRRPCGALRIVLMRHGNAEVGADAVARVGLHDAAVLLDGVAHLRDAAADEHAEVVRRQPLGEGGGTDDVREQRRQGAQLTDLREPWTRWRLGCGLRRAPHEQALVVAQDRRLEIA